MKTATELKKTIQDFAMLAADYRAASVPEAEKLNPRVWEAIEALNADIDEVYTNLRQTP